MALLSLPKGSYDLISEHYIKLFTRHWAVRTYQVKPNLATEQYLPYDIEPACTGRPHFNIACGLHHYSARNSPIQG